MKFNCGPTRQEKFEAKEQWHQWFAWRPVRLSDERGLTHDCRWLEYVERKGKFWFCTAAHGWDWKYRELMK